MDSYPDSTPTFWFQPPVSINRRRASPIDPVFLIILIPVLLLLFLFFFLPPFLSHTSHILLKPGSVKSTWDSVYIFLILFAILCGVLMARKNDDDVSLSSDDVDGYVAESSHGVQSSGPIVGFPNPNLMSGGLNGYNQNRFSDEYFDVDVYNRNLSRRVERENENLNRSTLFSDDFHLRSRRSEEDPVDFLDVKEIGVDTFVIRQNSPEIREEPPPKMPLPPSSDSNRHLFRSVGKNVNDKIPTNIEYDDLDKARTDPPLPLPLPPPPPPELRVHRLHHKHNTLDRKVTDVATVISSLYNQRKRKNKRQFRITSGSSETSPPLPPSPLPSVFQNLFKNGGNHKKIHSVVPAIVPPPPPPPPPPLPRLSSIFNNMFKSGTKSKRFNYKNAASSPPPPPPPPPPMTPPRYTPVPVKSKQLSKLKSEAQVQSAPSPPESELQNRSCTSKGKPPLPTKTISYYDRNGFLTAGSQSPLVPLPPPPPPFKVPEMKFEVRGDFVKIRSVQSSLCSSPDHNDDVIGDLVGPDSELVCFPSPDVNAKADSFISRLKDEWRMEKIKYHM